MYTVQGYTGTFSQTVSKRDIKITLLSNRTVISHHSASFIQSIVRSVISSMMVVEVKVCPTAPEKYNHSRKLPSPDFSAIIQTAFLYNQPCQITTNPNTRLGVFIKINSKQGRLIAKLQEISAAFLF